MARIVSEQRIILAFFLKQMTSLLSNSLFLLSMGESKNTIIKEIAPEMTRIALVITNMLEILKTQIDRIIVKVDKTKHLNRLFE